MSAAPGGQGGGGIKIITPVYRNEATLAALAARVEGALGARPWRLHFVVDASPDASLAVARRLAAADHRIRVTALAVNIGQHAALARGLHQEPEAAAWVCLDADLQDPPEAIPALLARLEAGDVEAVFAGRRGRYESHGRLATGRLHREVLSRLTGLPADAGAFVAMGSEARRAVMGLGAPSIVAAIGASDLRTASVPVERSPRPSGQSGWSGSDRLRQAVRSMAWVARERLRPSLTSR